MQASPKNFDVEKLQGVSKIIAKVGSGQFDELLKVAADESLKLPERKEAFDLIKKMIDLGRRTQAYYEKIDLGPVGSSVRSGIRTLKNVPK